MDEVLSGEADGCVGFDTGVTQDADIRIVSVLQEFQGHASGGMEWGPTSIEEVSFRQERFLVQGQHTDLVDEGLPLDLGEPRLERGRKPHFRVCPCQNL